MNFITTNESILKIEALQTKFDLSVVSNSLVNLIGSYLEARIVQQIHYWTVQEYGQEIRGKRWIYKPIREWLCETIIGFSKWQLRMAIAALVEKGVLLREYLFKEHHGHNFSPKNRTYYYSLNYEGLEKLAQGHEMAESTENVRFVSTTKQFCESSEKQFCGIAKNKTESTSIENRSRDKSHPSVPCESKNRNHQHQSDHKEKQALNPGESFHRRTSNFVCNSDLLETQKNNSTNHKLTTKEINVGDIEQKVNTEIDVSSVQDDLWVTPPPKIVKPKTKPRTPRGTKSKSKRSKNAPWKDQGQFKRFYLALIQALPIVANARSPQGLAQVIIRQLRSGVPHSYWDDFVAGVPIGTSTKPEWEVEPGVPYPMFIEYLTEKIIKGNNTQTAEQARNQVFYILSQPRQAAAFWGQFKHSVVNVSQQMERDRDLGVSNPNTPVWTRERVEPSISEAIAAGKKITAANGANQAEISGVRDNSQLKAESENNSSTVPPVSDPWTDSDSPLTLREMAARRKIKGFGLVKAMPHVSQSEVKAEARQLTKPKTNISQMSIAEINKYLTDPVLREQLIPQLMKSDYELITDQLGQILGVKAPPPTVE